MKKCIAALAIVLFHVTGCHNPYVKTSVSCYYEMNVKQTDFMSGPGKARLEWKVESLEVKPRTSITIDKDKK